jgi:hypothetical protein
VTFAVTVDQVAQRARTLDIRAAPFLRPTRRFLLCSAHGRWGAVVWLLVGG